MYGEVWRTMHHLFVICFLFLSFNKQYHLETFKKGRQKENSKIGVEKVG